MAITEWHYTIDGQPAAVPVSAAQLKQLAASGQLKPTDLVWQEGMIEWAPAGSIKGLFPPSAFPPPKTGATEGSDLAAVPPNATRKVATRRKTDTIGSPRDWSDLSPLLVFVLMILSGGVFGLLYAYKVCRAYPAKAAGRKLDSAGRPLGRVRHPFGVLLLSYLTLGFYFYYWMYRALNECNAYLGGKEVAPRSELSLMLIFPPYALHVAAFVLPELIRKAQTLAAVPETTGLRQTFFFLNPLLFFALPYLAMLCQEALNQIWLTAP